MTKIMKEGMKKIRLSLIIIQGKAKKCIYNPENAQKFKDSQFSNYSR